MPNISIDGKDYDLDSLSEKAKETLASIQFVKNEITRLEANMAVLKTADSAYTSVLKEELGT